MINNQRILAIIPARKGSKRVINKNLKDLNKKPLIQWTIEAAQESKYIDDISVSSDSDQIIKLSKNLGLSIPYKRPNELGTDESPTIDSILHCIQFYESTLNKRFDYILLLQPTSPLRLSRHIDESIEQLISKKNDALISVCKTEHPPIWMNKIDKDLDMSNFIKEEYKNIRSQDLGTFFRLNGAIYICNTERLLEEKSFFIKKNISAYIMKQEESIDIDNNLDFKIAEILLKERTNE